MSFLQAKTLPKLLNTTKDIAIVSNSGCGTTTALGICVVNHVNVNIKAPQVLVMCCSFEAAIQFHQKVESIAFLTDVSLDVVVSSFDGKNNSLSK